MTSIRAYFVTTFSLLWYSQAMWNKAEENANALREAFEEAAERAAEEAEQATADALAKAEFDFQGNPQDWSVFFFGMGGWFPLVVLSLYTKREIT